MLSRAAAEGVLIPIENGIALDEREVEESFIRASGPGGQNVNKVASAVQLRFDVRHSPSLPQPLRERLERLGGSRMTQDGVLVITAQRFRSQERNRQDGLDRLVALIRRAATPPRPRRPTRPSAASRQRRLADKARRGRRKRERASMPEE
jgi:ribosome-associated protein